MAALSPPQRRLRQPVCLGIELPPHVRDGELQRPRQLSAGPVQGVKSRAAAHVFASHLPHHHFGIGIDVEFLRVALDRVLQSFHQRGVLGNIIVLVPDPFGDPNRPIRQPADYNPNTRWPRISQASAVYIGHQFGGHFYFSLYLQDAFISGHRQDHYLVPFQSLAVASAPVNLPVQKAYRIIVGKSKFFHYNHLHFR